MRKGRSNQRPASSLPLAGRGRGGGVGADAARAAPTPPSPSFPRTGGKSRVSPLSEDLIPVGEFGRAHGLKGEVRLKSFTGEPEAIASYGPLTADDGRTLVLTAVRPAPGGAPDLLIARVDGVATREAAEALGRVRLHLPREKLPPPEEDEFLLADLIGLAVHDKAGDLIGTVADVPNYGGGDLLDIAPAGGGPSALLPFTRAFVPEIDLAGKRVVVDAPEDLFETGKPDERE